jgi:hypothetical protein
MYGKDIANMGSLILLLTWWPLWPNLDTSPKLLIWHLLNWVSGILKKFQWVECQIVKNTCQLLVHSKNLKLVL